MQFILLYCYKPFAYLLGSTEDDPINVKSRNVFSVSFISGKMYKLSKNFGQVSPRTFIVSLPFIIK
jgi:hypothetical protein